MRDLIAPFRISNGRGFKLKRHDPGDTGPNRAHQLHDLEDADLSALLDRASDLDAREVIADVGAKSLAAQAPKSG